MAELKKVDGDKQLMEVGGSATFKIKVEGAEGTSTIKLSCKNSEVVLEPAELTLEGDADHILAARFLKKFVGEDIDWVHVDLSASNRKGGLGHVPTDTTGFGVRYTLNLLQQQNLLDGTWN